MRHSKGSKSQLLALAVARLEDVCLFSDWGIVGAASWQYIVNLRRPSLPRPGMQP